MFKAHIYIFIQYINRYVVYLLALKFHVGEGGLRGWLRKKYLRKLLREVIIENGWRILDQVMNRAEWG